MHTEFGISELNCLAICRGYTDQNKQKILSSR